MLRKHSVLLIVLLVIVALWFGARPGTLSLTEPAQAQTSKSPDPRKWEYCAIVGLSYDSKSNSSSAAIAVFTWKGRRSETLDCGQGNEPLSIVLGRLGSEGWEVVGQVEYTYPGNGEHRPDTWLFKRPAL